MIWQCSAEYVALYLPRNTYINKNGKETVSPTILVNVNRSAMISVFECIKFKRYLCTEQVTRLQLRLTLLKL